MSALLLDSHIWLWLGFGTDLSAETIAMCDEAADSRELFLSPFSVWELSRKALLGEIELFEPVQVWMLETRAKTRVRMATFDFEVAFDMNQLPAAFHKDPVDRLLASTCRVHDMTLLTRDRALLGMSESRCFSARKV